MKNQKLSKINCLYCNELFLPKRRWMQKYCSESCRTLACRKRNNGVSATLKDNTRTLSNKDLSIQLSGYQATIESLSNQLMLNHQIQEYSIRKIESLLNENKIEKVQEELKELRQFFREKMEKEVRPIQLDLHQIKRTNLARSQELQIQNLITILSTIVGPEIGKIIFDRMKPKSPPPSDTDST